mmetsp:Transcript_11701/g.43599  ORF Transcript_11701/g.43599 Transcript_11701/m.43599 type:complete len:346 (-) Transcript_11701:1971-3008(-)
MLPKPPAGCRGGLESTPVRRGVSEAPRRHLDRGADQRRLVLLELVAGGVPLLRDLNAGVAVLLHEPLDVVAVRCREANVLPAELADHSHDHDRDRVRGADRLHVVDGMVRNVNVGGAHDICGRLPIRRRDIQTVGKIREHDAPLSDVQKHLGAVWQLVVRNAHTKLDSSEHPRISAGHDHVRPGLARGHVAQVLPAARDALVPELPAQLHLNRLLEVEYRRAEQHEPPLLPVVPEGPIAGLLRHPTRSGRGDVATDVRLDLLQQHVLSLALLAHYPIPVAKRLPDGRPTGRVVQRGGRGACPAQRLSPSLVVSFVARLHHQGRELWIGGPDLHHVSPVLVVWAGV